MEKAIAILVFGLLFVATPSIYAATIKQTMEGGVDVSIQYPDTVIAGKDFSISIFIQNNGWEDKQDIKFTATSQDESIKVKNQTLTIVRLSKGGSFGGVLEFATSENSKIGTNYINALYSQVLLSNNETPMPPFQQNIAIPVEIKGTAEIQINTVAPSAIFPNAEFPFSVEVVSKDTTLHDVIVRIIPPNDVMIRGQTAFSYSTVEKDEPVSIHTQIITSPTDVAIEHKLPFEVTVQYTDDSGQEKTTSKTIPLLLRPRTFMEFTTDGGIWIGGFFLAPYVSLGTLIGIPAGTLFSLMIRKMQKKKESKKKKK
ncbi:MAG: hypothetical protein AB1299_06240 [Thermoproteota archaeon]|jgi:hypothetical protein|nr:hypothetical protein [Candidatus Nitrosotenuis sp.]